MTDGPKSERGGRFARVRRARPGAGRGHAPGALFDAELRKVLERVRVVMASDRADFFDGSASYDHASLVIIRLAAMLEDPGPFQDCFAGLDDESRRGIITTRNIISHVGYGTMDDDIFWRTVTVDVPAVLKRLDLDRPE